MNNNNGDNINKCAMITGGSRHIGQGMAIVLAEYGYDIAVTYATSPDGALETKKQVEKLGRRCFIYEAHLEKPEVPEKVINHARKDLGRLDVMICNAGKDRRTSVLTSTAEDFDFLYANNLRNYLLCAGAAARHMVNDKTEGSIIMITSVRGQLARFDDFYYGGIKAAMDRACKSMALDLSEYNIRVNCIAPGAIWKTGKDGNVYSDDFTEKSIPLHRSGYVRDIGEAAAYLAGERSAYVTGTTLLVDGGLSLPGLWEQRGEIQWKPRNWNPKHYEKAMEMLKESQKDFD
ncbi:MAG: SDR family oxidoreductase [Oscillospiraceae bacterium]|nr:SDR family oxidoreductase [Oscillospiraceae bacterium]